VRRSLLRELERALRLKVRLPARDAAAIGDFLSDEAAQMFLSRLRAANRQIGRATAHSTTAG